MTASSAGWTSRNKRTLAAALGAVVLAITGIGISQCGDAAPRTSGRSGPRCTQGCPCGDTCIDCALTCHVKKPTCTKGCPCGDTCIDCSRVCRR